MSTKIALGIDVGGSGIKGAPVDLETGQLLAERVRIDTPSPSTPQAVAQVCAEVAATFNLDPEVPVGVAIPAPVNNGHIPFMANLDQSWTGVDANEIMRDIMGRRVTVINDADAAGYAEARYGAARGVKGLVIATTLGTGIGSALIYNGVLIPCSELVHLEIDGYDAEKRAAASIRTVEKLDWPEWSERLQRYYETVEMLFSPSIFVIGGGVSRKHDKFLPLLKLRTPIVPAVLFNGAGIAGAAALAAADE